MICHIEITFLSRELVQLFSLRLCPEVTFTRRLIESNVCQRVDLLEVLKQVEIGSIDFIWIGGKQCFVD